MHNTSFLCTRWKNDIWAKNTETHTGEVSSNSKSFCAKGAYCQFISTLNVQGWRHTNGYYCHGLSTFSGWRLMALHQTCTWTSVHMSILRGVRISDDMSRKPLDCSCAAVAREKFPDSTRNLSYTHWKQTRTYCSMCAHNSLHSVPPPLTV